MPTEDVLSKIDNNFTYHAPTVEQQALYAEIRGQCMELALYIYRATPYSREQSLALTNLEQVMFWANAAVARNK